MNNILAKIKKAELVGRGGGCFPVAAKWEMVKKARGKEKYVVCNGSEGEPGVRKDLHLFDNEAERVLDGMNIAIEYLGAKEGIIYLNPRYYLRLRRKLERLIGSRPIRVFRKPKEAGYVGGEETSALNCLEGKRIEPRLRPPFPPTNGLYDRPTLVNNVETFYNVSLAAKDEYEHTRLYTLGGDCLWPGVFRFSDNWTIHKILAETKNYPRFKFFVQVGGDASGECLYMDQLQKPAGGSGSITVYSISRHKPKDLMKAWFDFFFKQSCGQCTPCREGTMRAREILNEKDPDWHLLSEILDNLRDSSFCGLGCAAPIAVQSYTANVLPRLPKHNIGLNADERHTICECFTD